MQKSDLSPEKLLPFTGIQYGGYEFTPPSRQKDKAWRVWQAIEENLNRRLSIFGSACLNKPEWMQPLAEETRKYVHRNLALQNQIEEKYKILPF